MEPASYKDTRPAEGSSLVGTKLAVSKGKMEEVIDLQGDTLQLLGYLDEKLAAVTSPVPETDEGFVGYTHINAVAERQRYLNNRLRSILEGLVL